VPTLHAPIISSGGASLGAVEAECVLPTGAVSGRRRLSIAELRTLSERVNFHSLYRQVAIICTCVTICRVACSASDARHVVYPHQPTPAYRTYRCYTGIKGIAPNDA